MLTYQLRFSLKGTQPPVWRQVRIPANLTMESLHMLVQLLMEWEDCHLYKFQKGDVAYIPDDGEEELTDTTLDIAGVTVEKLLKEKGDELSYIYDFGDWWEMTILLEDIITDYNVIIPQLIGGERPAPPENCGGLPGYYQLLQILKDPTHPEYDEIRDWVGEYYDAESFDKEFVEEELEDYLFDYIYEDGEEVPQGKLNTAKAVQLAVDEFWGNQLDPVGMYEVSNELIRDLSRGTRFFKSSHTVDEFAAVVVVAIAQVNLLFDTERSIFPLTMQAVSGYFNIPEAQIERMLEEMEQCVIIEPIYSPYLMSEVVAKNMDIRKEIEKNMGLD